jgi:hypothetical protein
LGPWTALAAANPESVPKAMIEKPSSHDSSPSEHRTAGSGRSAGSSKRHKKGDDAGAAPPPANNNPAPANKRRKNAAGLQTGIPQGGN